MTIEESLKIIQSFLEKLKKEIDVTCSFSIKGEIKNITYDAATKTLSEPFPNPEDTDNGMVMLIPYLDTRSIKVKF